MVAVVVTSCSEPSILIPYLSPFVTPFPVSDKIIFISDWGIEGVVVPLDIFTL